MRVSREQLSTLCWTHMIMANTVITPVCLATRAESNGRACQRISKAGGTLSGPKRWDKVCIQGIAYECLGDDAIRSLRPEVYSSDHFIQQTGQYAGCPPGDATLTSPITPEDVHCLVLVSE